MARGFNGTGFERERFVLRIAYSFISKAALACAGEIATAVLMFLEVAELNSYRFFQCYGSQGRKLIVYLAKVLLPKLPSGTGGLGTDRENLEAFLTPAIIYKADRQGKGKEYILQCLQ
jgi:hypothetical protein